MSLQSDLSKIKASLRTYENLTAHAKAAVKDIEEAIEAIEARGCTESLRPTIRALTHAAECLGMAARCADEL